VKLEIRLDVHPAGSKAEVNLKVRLDVLLAGSTGQETS
jgi:hypothetical protein